MQLQKLIRHRSVCLCGPAPTLLGTGDGERIDSHDVVIRLGNWAAVADLAPLDYGKRTDILAINEAFARTITAADLCGASVVLTKSEHRGLAYRLGDAAKVVPFRHRCSLPRPLLGIAVIDEILRYDPRSLYVTGMDVYRGNEWYLSGDYAIVPRPNAIPHNLRASRHWLHDLADLDWRINLDDQLWKIVSGG